jgi:AraC-like DNA-binding protein
LSFAKKPITRASHSHKIDCVAAYLDEHLDETVDFARLCSMTDLSRFHLHRVFREVTGETIGARLRRFRLERARHELMAISDDLGLAARRAGYGSVTSFTRAFRTRFGIPPGTLAWRSRMVPLPRNAVIPPVSSYGDESISTRFQFSRAVMGKPPFLP